MRKIRPKSAKKRTKSSPRTLQEHPKSSQACPRRAIKSKGGYRSKKLRKSRVQISPRAIKPDLAGERKAQLWTNVWSAMLFLACRSFPQLFAQLSPIVPNSSQPFPAFSPKSFEIALQSFPKPPPNLPKTTQNPSKRLLGAHRGLKKSQKHLKSIPRAPQELPRAPPRGPTPSQTPPKGSPRPRQISF